VKWLSRNRGPLVLIAIAAQVLFPVVLTVVAPHLGLGDCPDTDAVQAKAQQYSSVVIGIEAVLVVAVTAGMAWWSASRTRRWAWFGAGVALMVLMAAFSLIWGGLLTLNFCNLGG